MATSDGKVRLVQVSPGEALALQLALHAAAAAGSAARELGYPMPTEDQWKRIGRRISQEALAAGLALMLPGASRPTDEDLDQAAELTALAAVREVLGSPLRAH